MANEEQRFREGFHGGTDPITKSLREQSTHYDAGTRITVYERLGLNKPGFWADLQNRKLDQQETDDNYEAPTPQWQPPSSEYQSQNVQYTATTPSSKIQMHKLALEPEPRAKAGTSATSSRSKFSSGFSKPRSTAPALTSPSSLNFLEIEKPSTMSSDYFFSKAGAAATARDNIPFGHGEPTQFEKMSSALTKAKKVVKGNTKGVSVLKKQQTSAQNGINYGTKNLITAPGKTQMNVHANGYASNYPYPNFG